MPLTKSFILKHQLNIENDLVMIMGNNIPTPTQLLNRGVDISKMNSYDNDGPVISFRPLPFIDAVQTVGKCIGENENDGRLVSEFFLANSETDLKRKIFLKVDLPYGFQTLAEAQHEAKNTRLRIFEVHRYDWKLITSTRDEEGNPTKKTLTESAKELLSTSGSDLCLTEKFVEAHGDHYISAVLMGAYCYMEVVQSNDSSSFSAAISALFKGYGFGGEGSYSSGKKIVKAQIGRGGIDIDPKENESLLQAFVRSIKENKGKGFNAILSITISNWNGYAKIEQLEREIGPVPLKEAIPNFNQIYKFVQDSVKNAN
ncbi:MAG: hypothetical protein ABSF18_05980, partial [Gammaproteobacteria bacterium]